MFTSEPSLIQRIERMISETPVIDPDTDLNPARPSADVGKLLAEPSLRATLMSVGMPQTALNPDVPAEEILQGVIPYLARIRNTAEAWCLYRIFRDLYDFHDPNVTDSNFRDLSDRISASAQNPDWGTSILGDRCQIRGYVTSHQDQERRSSIGSNSIVSILDIDQLFMPGVDQNASQPSYPALRQLLARESTSKPRVLQQVYAWLEERGAGSSRICRVTLSGGHPPAPSDMAKVNQALALAVGNMPLSRDDLHELIALIHWQVFGWHAERASTIQVVIDAKPDSLVGSRQPGWVEEFASTLKRFGNARFDLLAGCESSRRIAGLLATQCPNVSVTGSWRSNFSATAIADFIAREVHRVPMVKLTGFSSGASSAEWVYGKYQMTRKAMASGFARLIEAGYFEEDEIPPILLAILHDTPRSLYPMIHS
jgi:glucuronate isomerase